MKVLMLSTDRKIFETGSEVRARMIDYADSFGYLAIAVIGRERFPVQRISDRLAVFSLGRAAAFLWRPQSGFDLITSQDAFEHGLIAWMWSKRLGTKLQLQVHTDFLNPYFTQESCLNKLRVRLAKFLLPKADSVRVVSQRIADSIGRAGMKLKQAPIIQPVQIDLEKIKNAPIKTDLHQKYPQFSKIILMASRLTREKNIELAIEAIGKLIETKPNAGLIVVGSGPEESKLRNLAARLELTKNIIFEPWTDDLSSYYKTADLFLLTSFYEGYGRTIVEALAVQTPVIMSDVGLAGEVLKNGQGGLIFPVNDGDALVSKIIEVLAN